MRLNDTDYCSAAESISQRLSILCPLSPPPLLLSPLGGSFFAPLPWRFCSSRLAFSNIHRAKEGGCPNPVSNSYWSGPTGITYHKATSSSKACMRSSISKCPPLSAATTCRSLFRCRRPYIRSLTFLLVLGVF